MGVNCEHSNGPFGSIAGDFLTAEGLSASQEEFCSVKLLVTGQVNFTVSTVFTMVYNNRGRTTYRMCLDRNGKAVPLHTMEALGVRGGIAPTHS
jgi:hypothetical protein